LLTNLCRHSYNNKQDAASLLRGGCFFGMLCVVPIHDREFSRFSVNNSPIFPF
jgi:hypothetical protein